MFWKVLLHASQDEGLDLILLFPDQVEVMNLPGTIEALKKCREDLGKLYVHFNFLSPFRRLFVLSVTSLFYESDHEWEDQPGWGDEETQKNDEEQVSRTDLASKDSVLHTVEIIPGNNDVECITYCFLPFSCNYNSSYIQMYAAMFGWAMYQMMESNKTQIVWAKEEKLAS